MRSLTANELRDIIDINGLLLALINKDNKLFLSLLTAVDLTGLENINFKEYKTLEFTDKQKLVNQLTNAQINNIIYKLDKEAVNSLIDDAKFKVKLINRNN